MLLIVFQSVILRYPWSVSQLYSVSLVFSKALKKRFFAMLYKSKLEKKTKDDKHVCCRFDSCWTILHWVHRCTRNPRMFKNNHSVRRQWGKSIKKVYHILSNYYNSLILKHEYLHFVVCFSCSLNVFNFLVSCWKKYTCTCLRYTKIKIIPWCTIIDLT